MSVAAYPAVRALAPRIEPSQPVALPGGVGARLLAGPVAGRGPESLPSHLKRLGALLPRHEDPDGLIHEVAESGLTGRGGGAFPLARKLGLAARSDGTPVVVVNGSEGEPASRKDQILLSLRPHLVLDGATAAAVAVGAEEVVVYVHRQRARSYDAVASAVRERATVMSGQARFRIVDAPDTYLAGESSALAAFLDGRGAIPRAATQPLAAIGVKGRPTVVCNAETLAHLGLIARFGARWYREAGTASSPGSTLLTLNGAVTQPGMVVEVLAPVPAGDVLRQFGGWARPPRAVLFGGYAGTWVDGERAWNAVLDRHELHGARIGLGCGLLAVLGPDRCGLAETARLSAWLASQRAGQCGPCTHGMPALAAALDDLVTSRTTRAGVERARELGASVVNRGLCHLPDGAATLAETALEAFREELHAHRRWGRCHKEHSWAQSPFPLPGGLAP